jgi:hypothetical protein
MRKHGIESKPLWNTETGWWIGNNDGTPDHPMVATKGWRKFDAGDEAGSLMLRAFVLARAEGLDRFFWYSWDSVYGLGMRDAINLLKGSIVHPCELAGTVWTCKLERDGVPPKWIVWAAKEAIAWTVPTDMRVSSVHSVDGRRSEPLTGRVINLTLMPVLIE